MSEGGRGGYIAALFVLLVASAACTRDRRTPDRAEVPVALAEVIFAGCAEVRAGPVCELDDDLRALRVWLPEAQRDPTMTSDSGATVPMSRTVVDHGVLYRFDAPRHARRVQLDLRESGILRRWTLDLAPRRIEAEVVREARDADAAADPARAIQQLREAIPTMSSRDRPDALALLGRIELGGDAPSGLRALGQAIDEHQALGELSRAAKDGFAIAFGETNDRNFSGVRSALARIGELASAVPDVEPTMNYYAARLASYLGDAREALRALDAAERTASRAGIDDLTGDVHELRASVLAELGRTSEALSLLEMPDPLTSACDRAFRRESIGWTILVGEELDGTDASRDPRSALEEALRIFRAECPGPHEEANVLTNLAWASLLRSDRTSAMRYLAEARGRMTVPTRDLRVNWLFLEGRLALASAKPLAALAAFERLGQEAARVDAVHDAWMAAEGRAEALWAMGKTARGEAAKAEGEADRWLEVASRSVPLGEGRTLFLGARARSTRRRVDLALAQGRPYDALDAVRQSRRCAFVDLANVSRVGALDPSMRHRWTEATASYARLRDEAIREEESDWEHSTASVKGRLRERTARLKSARDAVGDVLTAVAGTAVNRALPTLRASKGELTIAYYPLGSDWIAFAAEEGLVRAIRLPSLDLSSSDGTLAATLFDPLKDAIARATRIHLFLYGALRKVDIHALPFRGSPLIAHCPIDYPLDLSTENDAEDRVGTNGDVTSMLVVGDPANDLPASREEATAVAASAASHLLLGREASRAEVERLLESASFFHYAGHGVFRGLDGWQSALRLASGDVLDVADVLTRAHVPAHVVLSGCETAGGKNDASNGEGLGLAQAFLLAGARDVVAATRAVDDESTARVMIALHRAYRLSHDLPAALRDAELAGLASGHRDSAAFRVLTR